METLLVTGLVRAGSLLVRAGISLLCGVVWLCSSACSSNLGSNRHRRKKSAAIHRCFLFLINLTSVLLGIVIVQSGFSGTVLSFVIIIRQNPFQKSYSVLLTVQVWLQQTLVLQVHSEMVSSYYFSPFHALICRFISHLKRIAGFWALPFHQHLERANDCIFR